MPSIPPSPPREAPQEISDDELRRCRRFVSVTKRVRFGKGVKLFAYGYADLAFLLAMSESGVRQAARRGSFNPGDLRSIFEFMLSRLGDKRVRVRLLGIEAAEFEAAMKAIEEAKAETEAELEADDKDGGQ